MKTPQDFLKDVSELRTNCKRLLDAVVEERKGEKEAILRLLFWDLQDALKYLDSAVRDCGGKPED